MKLGPDIPTIDGYGVDILASRWRLAPDSRTRIAAWVKRKYWRQSRSNAKAALKNCERVASTKLCSDHDNI